MNYIILNFDVEFNDEIFIKKMRSFDLEQSFKNLNNKIDFKKIIVSDRINFTYMLDNYKLVETICKNNYDFIMIKLSEKKWLVTSLKQCYDLFIIALDNINITILKLMKEKITEYNLINTIIDFHICDKMLLINNYTIMKWYIDNCIFYNFYYNYFISNICKSCNLAIVCYTIENYYNHKKPTQYNIISSICCYNSLDVAIWCLSHIKFKNKNYYDRLFKLLFKLKKLEVIKLLYKKASKDNYIINNRSIATIKE